MSGALAWQVKQIMEILVSWFGEIARGVFFCPGSLLVCVLCSLSVLCINYELGRQGQASNINIAQVKSYAIGICSLSQLEAMKSWDCHLQVTKVAATTFLDFQSY